MRIICLTVVTAVMAATGSSVAFADDAGNAAPMSSASGAPATHKAMRTADRQLARKVRSAIANHGSVDTSNLTVVARSGRVTLSGSVPSSEQVDSARESAMSVAGVTDVADKLTLRSAGH